MSEPIRDHVIMLDGYSNKFHAEHGETLFTEERAREIVESWRMLGLRQTGLVVRVSSVDVEPQNDKNAAHPEG